MGTRAAPRHLTPELVRDIVALHRQADSTLHSIAAALGIANSQVSRVLNGRLPAKLASMPDLVALCNTVQVVSCERENCWKCTHDPNGLFEGGVFGMLDLQFDGVVRDNWEVGTAFEHIVYKTVRRVVAAGDGKRLERGKAGARV